MRLFKRKEVSENKIREGLQYKLDKASNAEVMRWLDNIHTGQGMNVQELRKSLTHTNMDQALAYLEDIRMGAISTLAAVEVLGARLDVNWQTVQ